MRPLDEEGRERGELLNRRLLLSSLSLFFLSLFLSLTSSCCVVARSSRSSSNRAQAAWQQSEMRARLREGAGDGVAYSVPVALRQLHERQLSKSTRAARARKTATAAKITRLGKHTRGTTG